MRAKAPASSANLGPGFDALALALARYVEVDVEPAPTLQIETHGLGSDLPLDHSHLAARVVSEVLGHDRVRLVVRSDIPVARGLGSSAALAVAAAAAAGAEDPLLVAARFDGHAENAAASVLGGLVAAALVDGEPVARRLRLDTRLCFAVVVPDRHLETKEARGSPRHRSPRRRGQEPRPGRPSSRRAGQRGRPRISCRRRPLAPGGQGVALPASAVAPRGPP